MYPYGKNYGLFLYDSIVWIYFVWYNEAKKGGVFMTNQFTVSFEKIWDESTTSYLIEFQKNDIKDIAIQFLKLQYRKRKKS